MCSVEINCLTAGGAGDLDINMDGHILALVQSHYNFQGALLLFYLQVKSAAAHYVFLPSSFVYGPQIGMCETLF